MMPEDAHRWRIWGPGMYSYNFPTFPCRFPQKDSTIFTNAKVMRKACGLHLDRSWWLTVTQCFFSLENEIWFMLYHAKLVFFKFWINEYCIWEWCIYADIYYRWHGWCLLWWCWWSSSYPEWMRHIGLPFLCSSWGTHHEFFDWQASRQLIDGSNELGSQLVYQLVWNLIHFNCMGVMILVIYCWVWPFQYSSWRRFFRHPRVPPTKQHRSTATPSGCAMIYFLMAALHLWGFWI